MKGYMYILLCSNGQYYTGSTNNLNRRLAEHQNGEGANFTKKHFRNAPFNFLSTSLKEQSQGTGGPVIERNENPMVERNENPMVERNENPVIKRNQNPVVERSRNHH